MHRIKVRKKISKKLMFYILAVVTLIPFGAYQLIYTIKYLSIKNNIAKALESNHLTEAENLIREMSNKFGKRRNSLLFQLELLQKKDKQRHNIKNWQNVIRTSRYLQTHYYFFPTQTYLLLTKAYYMLGENYFNQAIDEIQAYGLSRYLTQANVEEKLMAFELFFHHEDWEQSMDISNQLLAKDPENTFFKINKSRLLLKMGKKTEAKRLLKEIVFNSPFDPSLKTAAMELTKITEEQQLYSETDFLYSYVIEKSKFDSFLIEKYISYLIRHQQAWRAKKYLKEVKNHVPDRERYIELKKLIF